MNRPDHQLLGFGWGAAAALGTGQGPVMALGCGLVASSTAGGVLSPDVDQFDVFWRTRWAWRLWARLVVLLVPSWRRQMGRHGDPAQHRGITHWWGNLLPVIAGIAWGEVAWPGWWWPLVWALPLGWASHLGGDLVHGRASSYGHRGPGIPFAPWWGHHGAGLKSDGVTAHMVSFCVALTVVWLLIVSVAFPAQMPLAK